MRRHLTAVALVGALGMASQATAQVVNVLYEENFNGVTLGPSSNERRGPLSFPTSTGLTPGATRHVVPNAYSHTGPAGWAVDNNFDNFGFVDLTNAGGTPVFDQTVPIGDPPVQLFKLGVTGVVVGNIGVPNVGSATAGPDEWEGWSFARKDFWVSAAGDQERSLFANASGNVAVVDADEYDDGGDGGLTSGLGGLYMNSGLTTAAIPVAGLPSVKLEFDSSWRAESYDDNHTGLGYTGNNQTAIIWATFDDGMGNITQDFLPDSLWDSDAGYTSGGPLDPVPTRPASSSFKADATNEHVAHTVPVPAGATSVKFTFGYINAANDWWWAVDNLAASDGSNPAFWSENFDAVPLGPSTNEFEANDAVFQRVVAANNDPATTPFPVAFTHAGPAGWAIDNSGMPQFGLGDNNLGVYEWEGWSFSERDFWAGAQTGGGADFLKADGPFAVADSDEFDDFGGAAIDHDNDPNTPNQRPTRPVNTVLATPAINVAGAAADSLFLQFDSSWRPEDDQKAVITADFGSGEVEVLRWESVAGANFHGDATNETVVVDLNNPGGASTLVLRFKYLDAGNNWWWAFDNVKVGTVPEPTGVALAACTGLSLIAAGRRRRGG